MPLSLEDKQMLEEKFTFFLNKLNQLEIKADKMMVAVRSIMDKYGN